MTAIINAELAMANIETKFLLTKQRHRAVMTKKQWPAKIDMSAAMYMYLFDDVVGADMLKTYALPAVAHALHYPPVRGRRDSLIAACQEMLCKWMEVNVEKNQIIAFNGIYGSYRTIISANPSRKILVPEWIHQTHKACFANCGREVIEFPVDAKGLIDLAQFERVIALHASDHPFVYINHNRGPLIAKPYIERIGTLLARYDLFAMYDADVIYTGYNKRAKPWLPLTVPAFARQSITLINLTKEYGAPGLRIGFGIGPARLITMIRTSQVTSLEMIPPINAFLAEQVLKRGDLAVAKRILIGRMQTLCLGLSKLGWTVKKPSMGVNLFIKAPPSFYQAKRFRPDELFCYHVLRTTNVQLRPGSIYGEKTTDEVRFVLCQDEDSIRRVLVRFRDAGISADMLMPKGIEDAYATLIH